MYPAAVHKRAGSSRWIAYARASSQVNGVSSREFRARSGLTVRVHLRRSTAGPAAHYDSRSRSQSRRICIPRRLLVWRQYPWVDDHLKQKWNLHFKVEGTETSLNPGGQQGICFPVSLTGKVRQNRDPGVIRSGGGAATSIVSQTGSRSASRSSSTR